MKYPEGLKSKKSKIVYWIFRQVYTFDVGRGQVIGRFTGMVPEIGIILIVLKYFNIYSPKLLSLIGWFIFAMVLSYILGWFYQKFKLDKIHNIVTTERNPIMNEVHKKVVKRHEEM